MITAIALRGRGHPIPIAAEVRDVMDFELVHVDPSFDVEDALRRFRRANRFALIDDGSRLLFRFSPPPTIDSIDAEYP